ncbi:tyrosine-type recombinase/integrase [Paracoccus broussonetiae]|uniref:tyrosine-type recombinase/integrase n=1 Tax=Paracoccus broussonetiae TaxID=3075834 RepID=UPI0036F38805
MPARIALLSWRKPRTSFGPNSSVAWSKGRFRALHRTRRLARRPPRRTGSPDQFERTSHKNICCRCLTQRKTGKRVRFEITETPRQSFERWIADPEMIGHEDLWPSRLHHSPHLSTRQYTRILREWVKSIGLDPSAYGTHSTRRRKVAQIYKNTGNLQAAGSAGPHQDDQHRSPSWRRS